MNQSCSCWPPPQLPQHQIQATSSTYPTAHGSTRSLTHWARPGMEPASSWMLVRFVTTEPWRELWALDFNLFLDQIKRPSIFPRLLGFCIRFRESSVVCVLKKGLPQIPVCKASSPRLQPPFPFTRWCPSRNSSFPFWRSLTYNGWEMNRASSAMQTKAEVHILPQLALGCFDTIRRGAFSAIGLPWHRCQNPLTRYVQVYFWLLCSVLLL